MGLFVGISIMENDIRLRERNTIIFGHAHQPPMRGLWPYELPPTEPGESAGDGQYGPITIRYGKHQGRVVANHTDQVSGECYLPNLFNLEYMVTGWTPSLLMQLGDHSVMHNRQVFDGLKNIAHRKKNHFLAEMFSHPIGPNISDQTLSLQLDWGIGFYEWMFGTSPKSMWFAEAAVNLRVLKAAADRGIENTILSPWQVDGAPDSFEPCFVELADGKSMNVIIYNHHSQQLSFEDWVTQNADNFIETQLGWFGHGPSPRLMLLGSDFELYSHHKPDRHLFAERYFERVKTDDSPIRLFTSIDDYLRLSTPSRHVRLNEDTAWSQLDHHVRSWKQGGSGNWKHYVYSAIQAYDEEFWKVFYNKGSKIFKDPLRAAKNYIKLILNPGDYELLKEELRAEPTEENLDKALCLLDAVTFVQFMHTSCATFWDNPSMETEGAYKAAFFSLSSLARSGLYTRSELELLQDTFLRPLRQAEQEESSDAKRLFGDYTRVVGYHKACLISPIEYPDYHHRLSLHFPQLFGFTKEI